MARKGKVGIQYFSHDVDMSQDKKIKIIKAKYGLVGYAVYLRLLEEVYREEGYYLHIDEDFNILFSDDNNISFDDYILILNECIEKKLFNSEMYEEHNILTSERIQQNYCDATERRKKVEFIGEYLLIDAKEKYNTEKVNVCILTLNANICTQSKEKVKRKEIKEEDSDDSKNEFYEHDSDVHRLTLLLITEMIKNDSNAKVPKIDTKQFKTWCDHIEKLIRLDKREPQQIANVINWCQNSTFWISNIMSTAKLRKQYPTLLIQYNNRNKSNNNSQPTLSEKVKSIKEAANDPNSAINQFLKGENNGS